MKLDRALGAASIFGTCLILNGCLNDSISEADAPSGSEQEAIEAVIYEEMADYADTDVRTFEDGSNAALAAPIETLRWRRELQSFERSVNVEISENDEGVPTAHVTAKGNAIGLLHLWGMDEGGDEPWEILKDFEDEGSRQLLFERVRRTDRRHRGWKLAAVSGVEISSPGATRTINSITVSAGDVSETVTGVSELVAVEDLITLPAGNEVTVTVDTGDATDSVFLHVKRRARARMELTNNGDGTFTGTYMTSDYAGPRHAVVDVLSNGTLFDDEEAYDNVAWGVVYRIGRVEDEDRPELD